MEKDECSESINQKWSESATDGKGQNSDSTNSRTYQTWNVSKVSKLEFFAREIKTRTNFFIVIETIEFIEP